MKHAINTSIHNVLIIGYEAICKLQINEKSVS